MDQLKLQLSLEVTKITKEEVKGLKRICACEYYEVAFYLGGTLLFEMLDRDVSPNSPEMKSLVYAVIAEHFLLFDDGNDLLEGKESEEEILKLNGRVGNHLTSLPFVENATKEAGGIKVDGEKAFNDFCEASGLKNYKN